MKNDSVLTLKEALQIFSLKDNQGLYRSFDMEYRTFNSSTKRGGKLIKYIGIKYLPSAKKETIVKKHSNHFENRTRNIELSNGRIKTVKIDYIISVNNKKVIY